MHTPISIDELKQRHAAMQQSKEDSDKRLADDEWNRMSIRKRQQLAIQRIRLGEFLNLMGEIFPDELPVFVPTSVNVGGEGSPRVPKMPWKPLFRNMQGEQLLVWMQKMEEAVCGGGCVQVRMGNLSGNLCSLDVDHDDLVEPLLEANPILADTLQTRGSKGRTFWFFAEGEYPQKKQRIFRGEQSEKNPYKIEYLTEGNLCTIWGTHYKTGGQYEMVHKAAPIPFNLDDLKLPVGFAWEVKVSSNGQKRGTFTGGFRTNGASKVGGKIDWKSYDVAREEEPEIVEFLVGEYFDASRQDKPDGSYSWRCGNICGDPAHDGKQGSFEIDSIGRCTEWADETHYSIMDAICSEERSERYTYRDAFTFLAEQGYNFFMSNTVTFPDMDARPCNRCYDEDFTCLKKDYPAGVYHHDVVVVENDKGKKDEFPTDDKICQPIRPVAETYTKEIGEHSLLVEILPTKQTEWKKILIPKAALISTRSDEVSGLLANAGANIISGNWKHVKAYVEHLQPEALLTQVKQTGWVDKQYKTFILPHKMLGDLTKTYFDSGLESKVEHRSQGTLQEWQDKVAAPSDGNNWLIFSLAMAFTGPLLEPLTLNSFGVHLHGDSSTGKTTVLRAGASVWGAPRYLKTWRTTPNGLEITCANRSGTLLLLDESGEATAEAIAQILYMLGNELGKGRMNKEITARVSLSWRLVTLSSGEGTLETQIESARGVYKVGQEVRVPNFNATKCKHGAFDNLPVGTTAAEFSQQLSSACAAYYGTAGIEFVERLIAHGTANLQQELKQEETVLTKGHALSTQDGRVAHNLAAVVLAGELAIKFKVLPFEAGTVRKSLRKIFEVWLNSQPNRIECGGTVTNREHVKIITAIREFIDRYGQSRFAPTVSNSVTTSLGGDKHNRVINDQAGYYEPKGGRMIYLFTTIGMKMAVAPLGVDNKRAATALKQQEALSDTDNSGDAQIVKKIGGKPIRLYSVDYEKL